MKVIPAIDLKDGKVVRLRQGVMEDETIYELSPIDVAKKWRDCGAELIHIVDLDAAVAGKPVHRETIIKIAKALNIPVEVGGGIRNMDSIRSYLEEGIRYVILGTIAHTSPELVEEASSKFPERIIVSIDAKKGKVAISGWRENTEVPAKKLAERYQKMKIRAIVFTEIERDGMLKGPAIAETKAFAESLQIPVIASGGVSKIEDLIELKMLEPFGVEGVIVGRALYEGRIDLKRAIEELKKKTG